MTLPPVSIFRTADALIAQRGEDCFRLANASLDALFAQADPARWLHDLLPHATPIVRPAQVLAPMYRGDVGVTGGLFTGQFVAPSDAALGPRGRMRGYLQGTPPGQSAALDGVGSSGGALSLERDALTPQGVSSGPVS